MYPFFKYLTTSGFTVLYRRRMGPPKDGDLKEVSEVGGPTRETSLVADV